MNTHYILPFILFSILITFSLDGNTTRLLVALGEKCDLSPQGLASDAHALVVSGTEKSMREQIVHHDMRDNTHLFILYSPDSCLPAFASDLCYDYLILNDDREHAYNKLNAKIASLPATSDELPQLSPEERGEFYSLLMKVSDVLNDDRIAFWGISGTLLGAVRHAMVSWDDDIDIVICHKDQQMLKKIAKSLKKIGLELYAYQDYYYKIFSENGSPVIEENKKYLALEISVY
ncbi:MAG: LicD family protein [Chlamydiales bacterium]|nr:LicD family protein [Chlamydiales bacterium]